MRRVLCLLIYVTIVSIHAQGQDFVSRYRTLCEGDTTLVYVSVSPKMMEKALKSDTGDNNTEIQEILSHMKSMQVISGNDPEGLYFTQAKEILKRNEHRYSPYSSYEKGTDQCCISIRKHRGSIVELVMLRSQNCNFIAISFIGELDEGIIQKIAEAIRMDKTS